jgi:repressor LexA
MAVLPLTERQREVLEFIKDFAAENGYPPTVREIGAHFGFVPRSVFDHLKALARKGYIRRRSSKSRSLEILDGDGEGRRATRSRSVPLVGRVAAGRPLLAVENLDGAVTVSREWVAGGDEAFALRVEGDSMLGAHILPGDLVVVRRQESAVPGDIIVALVDDEATVKRFGREGGKVVLRPENPAVPPLVFQEGDRGLQILGKVVGVLRRL